MDLKVQEAAPCRCSRLRTKGPFPPQLQSLVEKSQTQPKQKNGLSNTIVAQTSLSHVSGNSFLLLFFSPDARYPPAISKPQEPQLMKILLDVEGKKKKPASKLLKLEQVCRLNAHYVLFLKILK